MDKKAILGSVIVLILVVVGLLWRQATTIPSYQIEMAAGEEITSWDFDGVYENDSVRIAKALEEIARLKKLIGTGEATDYELYVSIANQYDLIGDGKKELEYLQYALAVDAENSGLAWNNAGALFTKLGAPKTARMAHERAFAAQSIAQYRTALAEFLKIYFPSDTEAIRKVEEAPNAELSQ